MGTDPQHDTSLRAAMLVLALDRATAQAAEALEASEIPTLLLKGPVTARWLYADGSTRPYSDVDLLVAPRDYAPAEETLRALGFRRMGLDTLPVNREGYAITLRRPNDGLAIDLHHSFVGIEADDEAMWSVFAADAEPIVVADTELRMPSEPARALLLALHANKDGQRSQRVLRELATAIEVVSEDVWQNAAALAETLRATEAFGGGLRRIPEGAALAAKLGLPTAVSIDVALRAHRPPPLAVGMKWLLEEHGARRRVAVIRHKLLPSREFMQAWHPLARRGTIGLGLAYAWRLLWVTWHAVPALLAVLRARRRARGSA